MNFLEANRIVAKFAGGPPLPFLLAMSGGSDKLTLFLKAAGAQRGRSVVTHTLPFNTLAQSLLAPDKSAGRTVFVVFPWDLVPEGDWRSGLPASPLDLAVLEARAQQMAERLASRADASILYVPAPLPPLFPEQKRTSRLEASLTAMMAVAGADIMPEAVFSLASYLSTGSPFATASLGLVAEAVVARAIDVPPEPRKVLVTDLDNVMWRGVIGEDGPEGIHYQPEGAGFRHFVYQTLLAKIKREGGLLAAVSRNDDALATAPFQSGKMTLRQDDLVAIVASYGAKSSQIKEIARQLNLGLDSFVFVDDNPIEIAEVAAAIPEIRVVQFPSTDDALAGFIGELAALFARAVVTTEDADRTSMYKRRLQGIVPVDAAGADLTEFLRGLEMTLTIHDRSTGDRTRAVQLINKTNQFNLNGRRVTDEDVAAMLGAGGRLYTCTLGDRTGTHGEILACLIDGAGVVRSLVMSCRVFQRRAEYAFFAWLGEQPDAPSALDFEGTARNEPIRQFLEDAAFSQPPGNATSMNAREFARAHAADLTLFACTLPNKESAVG